ncbi:hypothetical protein SVAN01_04935 [Stagonosporopsis vannaccii]|nr:hypothetical protein SVAN01_04935 [Stagonosporopsis vannaccii]
MGVAVLIFLACSIGLAQALVIPGTRSVQSSQLLFVADVPRAGKCPKVNLVRGKQCVRTLNAKQSGVCLPPSQSKDIPKPTETVAQKAPVQSRNSVPQPRLPSQPPRASARTVEKGLVIVTLDKRADKTLGEMSEIASFDRTIGDTATTIGLEECSVIALYDDKAIVWGHYSPGMTLDDGTFLDYQKTLDLALAKAVVRVDSRAASMKFPAGMPNLPQIIATWYQKLGVTILNGATYKNPLSRRMCTIEHASRANGEILCNETIRMMSFRANPTGTLQRAALMLSGECRTWTMGSYRAALLLGNGSVGEACYATLTLNTEHREGKGKGRLLDALTSDSEQVAIDERDAVAQPNGPSKVPEAHDDRPGKVEKADASKGDAGTVRGQAAPGHLVEVLMS